MEIFYIEFYPLIPGTAKARPISEEAIANYGPDRKLAGMEILDASLLLGQAEKPGVMDGSA